ncbi:hypothetical protein ACFFU1_03785 [Algibacter miyuki]|uniref:Uncharacterized protein n=1 Tax=Algibacter miyuki TaxID=1306933 RepID=A0ABV5GWI6_9FLAO|nr:hypothetical protein [Algibacter miyuki]MDN3664247.1 hypothetical protein [Algibacter miyuki]
MNTHKIIKIIAFALAILGSIFALMIISGSDGMIDNILFITYAVLGLVLALVLIFVLKGLVTGDIKKTLMTVGAFLAVIFITYAMSSGTDLDLQPFNDKGLGITEATSKNVGAGLYAFYVLAFLAIGSMLFGGVKKILNK